ncbi:hypothetical protein G7046_g9025 [Stylonectria norvegica]|nr:hypothetical protein G7046_g9025 [Stylonectria norvegica]
MNDPPQLLKPTRHTSGQSPTRHRLSDDILAHLAPPTAVDALTTATGALKACLTGASMAERDFAMRTAVTSKTIWEWVDELQDWSWPSEGGPAGFEMPSGKRRLFSVQVISPEGKDEDYLGSLLAEDVERYERRIAEIERDLDDLDVEEIKSHVLNNHILPLSRPNTPLIGPNRPDLSTSSYNKMEDITAAITAIVVQALPNLARLARLLQTWNLRLVVLRRVPPLLLSIEDAEVALQSGWNVISLQPKTTGQSDPSTLARRDFEVMKLVLEKKISYPGRSLDYMLDCLEGLGDTLPEEWLDRMEAVERWYSEWVAACERKIREADWTSTVWSRQAPRSPSPQKKAMVSAGHSDDHPVMDLSQAIPSLPMPTRSNGMDDQLYGTHGFRKISEVSEAETAIQDSPTEESFVDSESDGASPLRTPEHDAYRHNAAKFFDGAHDAVATPQIQPPTPIPSFNRFTSEMARTLTTTPSHSSTTHTNTTDDTPSQTTEDDSPQLPSFRHLQRRTSDISQTSTILHGASSHFGGMSSDLPEISASPDLPRTRIREAEYIQASPPSSPPMRENDSRESSMTPFDSPLIIPNRNDDDYVILNTPLDESFTEETEDFDDSFSVSEITSPFDRRESTGDQQLRQQISQIIESIPAKIKLSAEPPAINLNPPDLQLPRLRKKTSIEPFRRSASSLSSRAGTPSFTLSPAKNSRPRNRGQQEIKVYHLSRSTGEAPIKLFIRCVGNQGERVMVRVGGGWADLGEYLKEYASHHKRRSVGVQNARVEVQGPPQVLTGRSINMGSSPPSRPASALELSPMTPLAVRKTRRSMGAMNSEAPRLLPKTPALVAPTFPP